MKDLLSGIVRRPGALAAAAALALVAILQVAAIHRQSLTYDEPYHLLAGYQALYYGENLVNYEHPPLVKITAALPLLTGPVAGAGGPLVELTRVEEAYPAAQLVFADPARERRIRLASRYALLALVVAPLLAASWALGRRLATPATPPTRAGLVLALMLGLSFAALPHLATLQTDAALALGTVLTLLAGLAYLRRPDARRAALLGLALGLACAVKLSGLLLLPTAAAAIALAPRVPLPRRLLHLGLSLAVALALLQATYLPANRNYDPARGRTALRAYAENRATLHVGDRLARHLPALLTLERVSPGLAQHATGLLGVRAQDAEGVYNSYAFGRVTARGRWWYFPAVFLLKTPLPILLPLLAALASLLLRRPLHNRAPGTAVEPSAGAPPSDTPTSDPRTAEEPSAGAPPPGASDPAPNGAIQPSSPTPRGVSGGARRPPQQTPSAPRSPGAGLPLTADPDRPRTDLALHRRAVLLVALTAAVYLLTAGASTYNLGLRHLLPVLPLLYLPAALWTAATARRTALVLTLLAAEAVALTPVWMSATNTWWLGERNPTRFALGDTNLEYHQSFLALAADLDRRGIHEIGVAMPAVTAAELACYVPGARPVAPGDPLPPGWYALSASVEQMAPALLAAHPTDLFRPETFQRAARDWSALAAHLAAGEDHGYAAGTFHLYRIAEGPPL